MLSRIENQSPALVATPPRGQTQPQPSQAFSDLLAGESVSAHVNELPKGLTDAAQPDAAGGSSGQVPVATQAGRQVLDTPQAAPSVFNPLAIFEPKASPTETSTGAQPTSTLEPTESNPAPFVPKFQQNLEVVSAYGGSSALNPIYFATPETAQWIANKYGTGEVVARPYDATGGPYSANGTEYYIRLTNGKLVNAGLLADYYRRMPEAQFPGLADRTIRQGLGEEPIQA